MDVTFRIQDRPGANLVRWGAGCVECHRAEQRLVTDGGDRDVDIFQLSTEQAAALGEQRPIVIHTGDRSIFLMPESVRISDTLAEIDAEVTFEYITDREVVD